MKTTTAYNTAMLPVYATWRIISRVIYLISGWWLIKRIFGLKTGGDDLVSKSLHR